MPVILGDNSISIDGKVIETGKSVGTYPDPLGTGEPVVTAGGSVTPVIIDADYKYFALTYTGVGEYPILPTDATNLKAWYKFDDNFNDSSGNNAHLTTLSGTPTLSTTQFKIGKSSFFTNATLKTNGFTFHNRAFSIAFWVYQTSTGFILGQAKANVANQSLHLQYTGNTYRFGFFANDLDVGTSGDINNWVHLVFQIDSNKKREIWKNGVRVANDTSASFLNVDNNDIVIGDWLSDAAIDDNFDGYIDDLRFYDKALTAFEVSQLYSINQTSYNINFPEDTECDILMVAGGGGGGTVYSTASGVTGAGGGAGGLIFLQNQTIPADNYTIKVGKGGDGDIFTDTTQPTRGKNGYNSSFSYLQTEAIGGGGGASRIGTVIGGTGGSGGGSVIPTGRDGTTLGGSGTVSNILKYDGSVIIANYRQGFSANEAFNVGTPPYFASSAGGGASDFSSNTNNGKDGISSQNDTDFKTHFNITDTNIGEHNSGLVYFAGGGAVGGTSSRLGGLGGGADSFDGAGLNGQPNTGGGGSGSRAGNLGQANGGNGGSGIVLIRYPRTKIPFDAQWTYSALNANVYHMGNVGIGITNPTNALHVVGDTFSTTYSAGKKTFKIEHPLKINKWLYHGCIEGPRFDNIYRGKKLIIEGKAEVDIDKECNTTGGMTSGTFPALNTNYQLYLQNNQTYDVVKGSINGSTISIECENITDEIEVDWMVVGERHDEHVINTPLTDSDGNLICEHDI